MSADQVEVPFQSRIVCDPEILSGKLTVRGTRISVDVVLERLAFDLDVDAMLRSYPRFTREGIQACIQYARAVVVCGEVSPAEAIVAASGTR